MKILLINPPVTDFACYDYWLKPLGLLYLAAILREEGHTVKLIDSMDRYIPEIPQMKEGNYGQGEFFSIERVKPEALKNIPKKYKSFGIPPNLLEDMLNDETSYDYILMSSGMTYWYEGVREASEALKKTFPDTPLILGGVYATLIPDHASKNSMADYILKGNTKALEKIISVKIPPFNKWPAPDYSDYQKVSYAVIRTSYGCRKSCSYCGIKFLSGGYEFKEGGVVSDEVRIMRDRYQLKDIVFYDDDLLFSPGLNEYLRYPAAGVRIHTPNGLSAELINGKMAQDMMRGGFIDPCVSADILSAPGESSERKVSVRVIEKAVKALRSAGYKEGEFSSYILGALPGQNIERLEEDICFLNSLGARVRIAEYAPVPGSLVFSNLPEKVRAEPLLHNNSIYPALKKESIIRFREVKRLASRLNGLFRI